MGTVPKFDRSKPLDKVSFHCRPCKWSWDCAPERVQDDPDVEHHPFQYFAACPICQTERPQAGWERALLKAWQSATGPKTDEGKAATAANLIGHPTPEEAKRTRFNAMKHGLFAQTATYFPAKPDGYSFCSGCDIEREWCREQPACVKQTQTFLLHQAAFEQRDPKKLSGIYANLHAGVFALIQNMVQTIVADGVVIESLVWRKDKNGEVRIVEYVDEKGTQRMLKESVQEHPLLRPLGQLLTRTGLTLGDMGMTTRVQEQAEEFETGFKKPESMPALTDVQNRAVLALENLAGMVAKAKEATDKDPVLLEFNAGQGEESHA